MPRRPNYLKCIAFPIVGTESEYYIDPSEGRRTWCGRITTGFEWCFVDIDHAALNALNKGYMLTCSGCVAKITKALNSSI